MKGSRLRNQSAVSDGRRARTPWIAAKINVSGEGVARPHQRVRLLYWRCRDVHRPDKAVRGRIDRTEPSRRRAFAARTLGEKPHAARQVHSGHGGGVPDRGGAEGQRDDCPAQSTNRHGGDCVGKLARQPIAPAGHRRTARLDGVRFSSRADVTAPSRLTRRFNDHESGNAAVLSDASSDVRATNQAERRYRRQTSAEPDKRLSVARHGLVARSCRCATCRNPLKRLPLPPPTPSARVRERAAGSAPA